MSTYCITFVLTHSRSWPGTILLIPRRDSNPRSPCCVF
jgi:hypothetical protein